MHDDFHKELEFVAKSPATPPLGSLEPQLTTTAIQNYLKAGFNAI